MTKYARLMLQPVPQTEPLNKRQVKNSAGGYVFALDDFARLDRFLILGSDAPTYYASARKLTKENAACVTRCYDADYLRTVQRIVEISDSGRAPKNDAAIFALALGAIHKDVVVRRQALAVMPSVCRIGTHLFQFVSILKVLGKKISGRSVKRAIANWYDGKPVDKLAYQVIKYRSRENLTHKNLLQLAHPKGDGTGSTSAKYKPKDGKQKFSEKGIDRQSERSALYRWICGKDYDGEQLPQLIGAHLGAMSEIPVKTRVSLIEKYRLPWEAIPTEFLRDPDVWRIMLPNLGMTALIRNLGGMTELGTLAPFSNHANIACMRLTNQDELRKARVHPFNLLVAHAVYKSGKSVKGSRTWKPIAQISDALEDAFYLAFKTIVPTGKRTMIGLDVSGSMSSPFMGSPLLVCEGAAAMAMTTMRTEKDYIVMAFDQGMRDLPITAKSSLADVLRHTRDINGGGTDCALPMLEAMKFNLQVDTFIVITDNETWAGHIHPVKALTDYRMKTGIDAKLIVVGMTSTNFTIADPNDGGCLDVIGFDSAAPAVIADFSRGDAALAENVEEDGGDDL